jgi:hypothetical protein
MNVWARKELQFMNNYTTIGSRSITFMQSKNNRVCNLRAMIHLHELGAYHHLIIAISPD